LFAFLLLPRIAAANGADLPPEIILQGYIKTDDGRLRQLVRVPLVFLQPFALPKRGPGYLDLARMDNVLQQAAAAVARQIELRADGVPLAPTVRHARVSVLSDHSFESYDAAAAHLAGPPLPVETNLFWNQGFFDAEIEYPIASPESRLDIRTNVMPGLGVRVRLQLEFLAAGKPARNYVLQGGSGWVSLDPRLHEAVSLFAGRGFAAVLTLERVVFLLCLLAPFTSWRSLMVVVALSALQVMTLTATAEGAVGATRWLGEISSTGTAGAMLLLAIANLGAPNLRRRWLLASVVGALGGFSLGTQLAELMQLAGSHRGFAVVSFDLGVVLAELAVGALAVAAMRLLFARVLGPPLGVVVVSALVGHAAWHWTIDGAHQFAHELEHASYTGLRAALTVTGLWLVPALLVGVWAWLGLRRLDGAPVPSLLLGSRAPGTDRNGARDG